MDLQKLTFRYGFPGLCTHKHETWPIRLSGEAVAGRTCLECGRRRPYLLLEPSVSSSPNETRTTGRGRSTHDRRLFPRFSARHAPLFASRPVRAFGRRSSDLPDKPGLAAHQVPAPRRQMGWLAVES